MIDVIDGAARSACSALGGVEVRAVRADDLRRGDAALRHRPARPPARAGDRRTSATCSRESEFKVFAARSRRAAWCARSRRRRVPAQPLRRADRAGEGSSAQGAGLGGGRGATAGARRSPSSSAPSEMSAANDASAQAEGDAIFIVADTRRGGRARARRAAAGGRRAASPRATTCSGSSTSRCSSGTRKSSAGTPLHHPFTRPTGDLDGDPGNWRARAYDLVMDGTELGGGSIRSTTPRCSSRSSSALGIGPEEARRALRLPARGAPLRRAAARRHRLRARPDRRAARGRDSIRDVIAFPKAASGIDPLTGAPAPVDARQLRRARREGDRAAGRAARAGP